MKNYVHTKTWMQMFIATHFIIAQIWKQPKCHSTGEWINKRWYIHAMGNYLAMKRMNDAYMKQHDDSQMQYSKWSQTQDATCYMLSCIWLSGNGKMLGIENESVVSRTWDGGEADYKRTGENFVECWNCSISWLWWWAQH